MLKGRRVGTFSAGVVFIVFGVLFLLRAFLPGISYAFVASFWPVVLILLGLELLLSVFFNREEKLRYDGGAIFLMVALTVFAMGMAGWQFVLEHWNESLYFRI